MKAAALVPRTAEAAEKPKSTESPEHAREPAPVGLPLFLQTKLRVGEPNDALERAADRVSERVVRGKSARESVGVSGSHSIQRKCACGTCAACQESELVQRKALPGASPTPPTVVAASAPGAPLAGGLRERIEPALGADLSSVRVHTEPASRNAADALQARAFTHRSHIYLGSGESPEDLALLAHEATHVVQQTGEGGEQGLLQRSPAARRHPEDGDQPRARILAKIRGEIGDDADALETTAHPAREDASAAGATPTPIRRPAAATPSASADIDRSELSEKKSELQPDAQPAVDRAAETRPGVERAAQETTTEAARPATPIATPQSAAAPAQGDGGPAAAAHKSQAQTEQAEGGAEQAFAAASAQLPVPEPTPVDPPRLVLPVDSSGAPVAVNPAMDGTLLDIAQQAQLLRAHGLNLRQHAAEERGNAELLRGNLRLIDNSVSQAETGVTRSRDHVEYRRSVALTARQSLDVSKEKAATVAEQAPSFGTRAGEGKAESGPMAREAGDLAGQSAANTSDDPEASEDAQEQAGKINEVNGQIGTTDSAMAQTEARAAGLGEEAAHATEVNTATEARLQLVDTRLEATAAKLSQMDDQNGAARGQMAALLSQPDELLAQADALDAQGQQMLDASAAIEERTHQAQDNHERSLRSLPAIRQAPPAPAPAQEVAAAAQTPSQVAESDEQPPPEVEIPAPSDAQSDAGDPEDYRYEDRATVDLAARLPSWFSGADPVSAAERAEQEEREQRRRADEVNEINAMAGGNVANISGGERAWIALRMTGRHLWGSASGIRWPGWGHLALGLIDPRGPLMGVVGGLSMMLSGGANLFSAQQWRRDPLGNLLKSAADIATGLTIILGSITALAGVIIAIMGAITLLSFGTAAPITGPIIAFCATVMTTVGGWTLSVGEVALILQGLVLIKNLIDAACAHTAEQLQNQSDKLTSDVSNAGNVVMQMGMAKLAQVGGRAMQAEIAEAGGGVAFARQVGGQATTGAGSYARAVGRSVRAVPGRIVNGARGAAQLFTREGARRAVAGAKGAIRGAFSESATEGMSLRQGLSREYLVGKAPSAAAGEAGGLRTAAAAAEAPRPVIADSPAAASHPASPPVEAPSAPAVHEPSPPPGEAPRATPPEAQAPPRQTAHVDEHPNAHQEPAPEPQVAVRTEDPVRAREQRVAESGQQEHVSGRQAQDELQNIGEHPSRVEGTAPNRRARVGEHEWREQPDGRWCRYSDTPTRCSLGGPPGVPTATRSAEEAHPATDPRANNNSARTPAATTSARLDDAAFTRLNARWQQLGENDLKRLVDELEARGLSDFAANSPAHKLEAWQNSPARARGESFEEWANPSGGTYHRNIANARAGRAREVVYQRELGGTNRRVQLTEPVEATVGGEVISYRIREVDVVITPPRGKQVNVQIKTSYESLDQLTEGAMQRARAAGRSRPGQMPNAVAIQADRQIINGGTTRVIWALEGGASRQLRAALEAAGIEIFEGADALAQIKRALGLDRPGL